MASRFSLLFFFFLFLAVSAASLLAASATTALSSVNEAAGYDVMANKAFGDEVRNEDVVVLNSDHLFEAFKKRFRKSYPTQDEQDYRFAVFKDNLRLARLHQKVDPSAVPKVTRFFDMTANEIWDRHVSARKQPVRRQSLRKGADAVRPGDDTLISQVVGKGEDDDGVNHVANAQQLFETFQHKFGKSYYSKEEHDYRFGVFKSNLGRLRRQKRLDPLAIHYLTRFLDLTPTELRSIRG